MQDPPAGAPTGAHEFNNFEQVTDPKFYAPLPDDYVLGLTDVVGSTKAIAAGRYKAIGCMWLMPTVVYCPHMVL